MLFKIILFLLATCSIQASWPMIYNSLKHSGPTLFNSDEIDQRLKTLQKLKEIYKKEQSLKIEEQYLQVKAKLITHKFCEKNNPMFQQLYDLLIQRNSHDNIEKRIEMLKFYNTRMNLFYDAIQSDLNLTSQKNSGVIKRVNDMIYFYGKNTIQQITCGNQDDQDKSLEHCTEYIQLVHEWITSQK